MLQGQLQTATLFAKCVEAKNHNSSSTVIFVCGTIVLENKCSSLCYYNLKERERKDLSTWFSDNWILDALA
jgi:hypothetical protein